MYVLKNKNPGSRGSGSDQPRGPLAFDAGVGRKLQVAALIDPYCCPHPATVLSCGRGVEVLRLALLEGHHAL
jgi:hypothetical protein